MPHGQRGDWMDGPVLNRLQEPGLPSLSPQRPAPTSRRDAPRTPAWST